MTTEEKKQNFEAFKKIFYNLFDKGLLNVRFYSKYDDESDLKSDAVAKLLFDPSKYYAFSPNFDPQYGDELVKLRSSIRNAQKYLPDDVFPLLGIIDMEYPDNHITEYTDKAKQMIEDFIVNLFMDEEGFKQFLIENRTKVYTIEEIENLVQYIRTRLDDIGEKGLRDKIIPYIYENEYHTPVEYMITMHDLFPIAANRMIARPLAEQIEQFIRQNIDRKATIKLSQ